MYHFVCVCSCICVQYLFSLHSLFYSILCFMLNLSIFSVISFLLSDLLITNFHNSIFIEHIEFFCFVSFFFFCCFEERKKHNAANYFEITIGVFHFVLFSMFFGFLVLLLFNLYSFVCVFMLLFPSSHYFLFLRYRQLFGAAWAHTDCTVKQCFKPIETIGKTRTLFFGLWNQCVCFWLLWCVCIS